MSEPQQYPAQPYGSPPPQPPHPGQPHGSQQYPGQSSQGQQYPGQQYPAQQYQGQPYPGQQYPGQQYPVPAPAMATGSLGRVAFIVGLVTLGIELLRTISFPFILRGVYDSVSIGLVTSIGSGLVLIAAVAALVLGLIAVRRADRTLLAGIAVGIGAAALAGILISWLSNMLYTLTY